jgi:hypothetical protein
MYIRALAWPIMFCSPVQIERDSRSDKRFCTTGGTSEGPMYAQHWGLAEKQGVV